VARTEVITVGALLLLVAIIGYYIPISITIGDTTGNPTIPQVVAFCDSGIGQFAQMSPQVVLVCSEYNNFMMGIYGAGLIGIILIIVGAVVPSSNQRVVEVTTKSLKRPERNGIVNIAILNQKKKWI